MSERRHEAREDNGGDGEDSHFGDHLAFEPSDREIAACRLCDRPIGHLLCAISYHKMLW